MGSWIVLDGGMGRGFPELFWMAGRGVDSRDCFGWRDGAWIPGTALDGGTGSGFPDDSAGWGRYGGAADTLWADWGNAAVN
ncbi:MAG: hypothetical protein HFH34_03670 [Eubacterium sp.]|nr:hypothetical protein [Eubacterium sp.]